MKIKKITCILLALIMTLTMAFALASCSGSSDSESTEAETAETESTEAESTEEASGIDLSAGITRTDNAETGESTVESDVFTLTLPNGESWDYEVESAEAIVFYNKAAKEADLGGVFFRLEVFEGSDEELDAVPTATVGEIDGKKIVVIFASDVEYDATDQAATDEYMEVFDAAKAISDDASTSPLVLK